jgi:hypothetical protein
VNDDDVSTARPDPPVALPREPSGTPPAPDAQACAHGRQDDEGSPERGLPRDWLPPDWVDGFPPDDWYADRSEGCPGTHSPRTGDSGTDDGIDGGDGFWEWWGEGSRGDGPSEPQWALDASARVERELLAAAASGIPGGESAQILQRLCPDGHAGRPLPLDAAGLLDGIAGLHRLVNWAQATQQRYLAALARPGVAVPLDDAVELASCPLGLARDIPDVPPAALLNDPAWAPAIHDAAIRLAAVAVGCALHVSPVTARSRTERAVVMVDDLPDTLNAQQSGDLDGFRASIIAERTAVLSPELRHAAERRVLPTAAQRTPGRLRDLVDAQVTHLDPEAAAKREQRARRGRGVRVQPGEDGMATVRAEVSGPDAQISYGVLDRIAATIQSAGLADGRGRSQIRADVFTDIFHSLAATGSVRIDQPGRPAENCCPDAPDNGTAQDTAAAGTSADGGRPGWVMPICVNVYVHASTLAGWDDRPGELDGHGIISAEFARALADSAGTVRAIAIGPVPGITPVPDDSGSPPGAPTANGGGHSTNPTRTRTCGTVLDAGRAVYRPRPAIADYVTARDRICTFPGCRARAERCDLDHRQPWDRGGATCPCNLDALCRFHHAVKTFSAWRADPGPDGSLIWESPIGRRYPVEPGHALLDEQTDAAAAQVDEPAGATERTDAVGPASRTDRAAVTEGPETAGDPADDPPPF